MKSLRRWQFDNAAPFPLYLAADARLSSTDYVDDQVWELLPGSGESPALALQTRYGGRAGLASIVPMWLHDGRPIYQAQAYAKPPTLTGFAPGYLRFQATLTSQLALQAEFWAIESHAVGARFTIANAHVAPATVRLDLVGFVGLNGKEQRCTILPLADNSTALSFGKVGNLEPVVILEGGAANIDAESPVVSAKIGRDFTIAGRKKVEVRFVHAGLHHAQDSTALAQHWLQEDWDTYLTKIDSASQSIPEIETGDADTDLTIAYSYHQLVQSQLRATSSLPNGSFVATRQPDKGFSVRGDGSDYDRGWSGQAATLAYLEALSMASVDGEAAQGIIRNYLAVQQKDGWVDGKPGLGGQKQDALCMPILARLSWGIFQFTEDTQFLRDVFPGLQKFLERWFAPDLDNDQDGLPEWQSESQIGYPFFPSFAEWQPWAQGANINRVESPDLAAYLLSEAKSLREIAYYLRETAAETSLNERIEKLQIHLESLWNAESGRYAYRDRETHTTTTGISTIKGARGEDELLPAEPLTPPNRLIVRVTGGMNLVPRMTMKLEGLAQGGGAINESVQGSDFVWSNGTGVYTSARVFAQIDRVQFEGLSRVYRIDVNTLDTTRLDVNALLPLWSAGLPDEKAKALKALLTNPDQFWRLSGITMNSARDVNFDPANAKGSGGVWPFWVTLMGEALVESGDMQAATDLLKKILHTQAAVLKEQKHFYEFYHSDEAKGLGEHGHLAGIVPLYLLLRILGVRVISSSKVWVGGAFEWGKPVTVTQREVTVQRSVESTQIEFPSGHKVEVTGDEWQEIIDPNA